MDRNDINKKYLEQLLKQQNDPNANIDIEELYLAKKLQDQALQNSLEDEYLNKILKEQHTDKDKLKKDSSIFGINALSKYLYAAGGPGQESRMIKDKRRTLDRAVKYSYQGAFVRHIYNEKELTPALINPNKLKQDYDDKVLSVGFEYDYKPGDVFEWCQTGTYWLIYLQDLTELAYFRGDIRKCSYEIKWLDEEGEEQSTYAAVRGPVETKINYIQKHQISVDEPNHSLNILMPLNEKTLNYFKRYSKFYLQKDFHQICWRVEAIDWISTPGILEVTAVEYYANETEDDIDEGLVGGLTVEPIDPNKEMEQHIIGETFIKPKKEYSFTADRQSEDEWFIDKKYPIEIIDITRNSRGRSVITLKWISSYSGSFELKYGNDKKIIVVESLF